MAKSKFDLEQEIDKELKKLCIYTDTLCPDLNDIEQRKAIKKAAALVKKYEKLA